MAADQNGAPERRSLVEGSNVRCPNCEALCHPFRDLKPLQMVEAFKQELNPIYKHSKDRGGCGHVFSPGEPWIIEAYLAGDLVPVALLTEAKETIARLQALVDGNVKSLDNAERREVA